MRPIWSRSTSQATTLRPCRGSIHHQSRLRSERTYNSTIWSNLIWDLDKSYRVAFEATYRKTEYKEPTNLPNKGFGFHPQLPVPWKRRHSREDQVRR